MRRDLPNNVLHLWAGIFLLKISEFNGYLLTFSKKNQKVLTVCQTFFKLKFSKFIQNIRTLNIFGKFLLIVFHTSLAAHLTLSYEAKNLNSLSFRLKGLMLLLLFEVASKFHMKNQPR